jgi:hypothetical protein
MVGGGRKEEAEVHNQKQEAHTKMWGKMRDGPPIWGNIFSKLPLPSVKFMVRNFEIFQHQLYAFRILEQVVWFMDVSRTWHMVV